MDREMVKPEAVIKSNSPFIIFPHMQKRLLTLLQDDLQLVLD
ncbi:MAG: hypothetical protein WDO71_21660 [Bacteroidota bacterium]